MYIKFKGEDLGEWRGAPRIKEARLVKRTLGLLPGEFGNAVGEMDPDALGLLVSILYSRKGKDIPFEEVDGEILDFQIELSEEEKRQAAEQEAAVVSPAISAALKELGVNIHEAHVTEVVLRHLEEAQKKADEGKDSVVATTTPSTSTSTETSTVTSPESSTS